MTMKKSKKIQSLLANHRSGTVLLASWLKNKLGISYSLQQHYLENGWLESFAHGAYKRPDERVSWQGGLHTLIRQSGISVHVGGLTALSMRGVGHYVRLGRERVYFFTSQNVNLPAWFAGHDWGVDIKHVRTGFLPTDIGIDTSSGLCTDNTNTRLVNYIADPERAILECLYLAPMKQDLMECYQIMEGLVNLRPGLVQQLLQACSSFKTNRLFLYMAEKAGHQWVKWISLDKKSLGTGVRRIVPTGVYIARQQIIVPKELTLL